MNDSTISGDSPAGPPKPTAKKKRNLPGMPDPDAEVVALSPKTLMATNRFVCEICSKGFQRDQNLQLHRRGHNLPWKLRQRSSKEVKKRVYVCPEEGCVHHEPSRALGDLTGIKKHFCRKHGEKKWKCDKCSKKYAVRSDWKAHSKICGTKEYKCDCGTLFSRRDSFITHRAFCDALAEESAKSKAENPNSNEGKDVEATPPPTPPPPPPPATTVVPSVFPLQNPEILESTTRILEDATPPSLTNSTQPSCSSSTNGSSSSNVFASLFASSTSSGTIHSQTNGFANLFRSGNDRSAPPSSEPISLCLSSTFGTAGQERRQYAPAPPQPPAAAAMSATALLQKAAQMGPAASNASLLRGLGLVSSSSSNLNSNGPREWSGGPHLEPDSLGLGLACDGGSAGLKELMLRTPSVFGPKHTTLDLLGLGMAAAAAAGGGSGGGLSALMTMPPFGGGGGGEYGGEDMQ
ncbi:hypothetical protein ABFS83_08G074300 [Erythranthe nasuta]